MTEIDTTPKVQVEYAVESEITHENMAAGEGEPEDEQSLYINAFQRIGEAYASSPENEGAFFNTEVAESGDRRVTLFKIGRKVLNATAPYQVHLAAEMLHLHVEKEVDDLVGEPGYTQQKLAGIRTFNNFPDAE